ncbi:NOL1/NOP2/sun family putative RNA methylase [Mobilisporobacter senegalensis]|uniref:NOL1/NOP2/sun family putative RNA methylase n=1 Tax=Mobilisporobacter senegalensis TaxID=1329262 RepID=A0A3N1XRP8_9FIRM|nr:RsmB/NOP family class I SAM-dependent RNA methyltransferase [Mobilisporobacter senegalensis]ROR29343.1 NOL1/NOP2/sun family putative RNA methylase [Mobilisporobacter senegalensis]
MNLPKKFDDRMRELLKEEYDQYVESLDKDFYAGLRVNNLKVSCKEFKEISPYQILPIPWTNNGFYYEKENQPAKHPYYYAGLYYIQEPSAMTPAAALEVKPGDKVLDLCAAPGGKSTELAAKLNGEGILVSNDISNSRAKALLKNIEMSGVRNAIVMSENPKKLVSYFEGYFDKILIDAPCSGEGMFRKEPSMTKNWEEFGVDYYSEIQKEIIEYAACMLKPGGLLAYSTCTFSPEENEGTIAFLLERHPEFSVIKLDIYDQFDSGKPQWLDLEAEKEELNKCVRIWPWKVKGEGHFLTILKKKEDKIFEIKPNYTPKKFKISEELKSFLKDVKINFNENCFESIEDRIYYLPEDMVSMKGLRILRSGLYIGDVKKNRFEPSQAFASALKMNEYNRVINLSGDDPNVIRYLKGETIEVENEFESGWNLLCVDGYPLGWGKLSGTTLKNKYYPGWRWLS